MHHFKPIIAFDDRSVWESLWYGYDPDERAEHTDYAWHQLHNVQSSVKGIIIFDGNDAIGFAHYILSENILSPRHDCYIKDLFVTPQRRGNGAASAALTWVKEQAKEQGWAKITLKTRTENHTAQRLYDRICEGRSGYVHYDVLTLRQ